MLRALAIHALFALLLVACKGAPVPPEAQPAAEAWLVTVDAGKYPESWTEAAPYFKSSIDSAHWEKSLTGVRAPLGKVLSRAVSTARVAGALPGAPDGDYVVFLFDTSFEHKGSAVETLTVSKDPTGTWRVAGYFIK